MKKKCVPLLLALVLVFSAACKKSGNDGAEGETLDKDTSYAIGMLAAAQFRLPGINLDYDAFIEGYKAAIRNEAKFTGEEVNEKLEPILMTVMANQVREFQELEERFFDENSRKPGIVITPSGLQYEVITQGTGRMPAVTDMVRVHYQGTLADGTPFDSSYDRGKPAEFPLQGVIPGWTEGLQLMNEGGSFRFYIPSALGYGDQGAGGVIPPYAPLIFDVELLAIID